MKKIFVVSILFLVKCVNVSNIKDRELKGVDEFYNGLYREIYMLDSDAFFGGFCGVFITDTITFRKYLGGIGDYDGIVCNVKNDSIVICEKQSRKSKNYKKVLKRWEFNINELKREGKFE